MSYIQNFILTGYDNPNCDDIAFIRDNSHYFQTNTFYPGSEIFFATTMTFLKTTIGIVGTSSGLIANKRLVVFLCDSIDGSLNFQNVRAFDVFSFTNSGSCYPVTRVKCNISSIFNDFSTNDKLLDNMTVSDIQNLKKSFKLIFRICNVGQIIDTTSLLAKDFVQDIHLLIDTKQPGPYEVNFENIDILSPNDFTDAERKTVYGKNLPLVGFEAVRCFYPKNINNISPIPLVYAIRANAGHIEQYDMYMSLFASYGYFCMTSFYNVTSGTGESFFFDSGIKNDFGYDFSKNRDESNPPGSLNSTISTGHAVANIGYLEHIKTNLSKISSGKFNNKIDFSKIVLLGHSRGGGTVLGMTELLNYKGFSGSLIEPYSTGITSGNIKCLISICPAKNEINQQDGSIAGIFPINTITENIPNIIPPITEQILLDLPGPGVGITASRFAIYQKGISQAGTTLISSSNVDKLRLNINIPTLILHGEYDSDVLMTPLTIFRCINASTGSYFPTARKKLIIGKKLHHNSCSVPLKLDSSYNGIIWDKYHNTYDTNNIFGNITYKNSYLASKVLEFISDSVYLTKVNRDFTDNYNVLTSREKVLESNFISYEPGLSSDIKIVIDDFSNGIAGFTHTIPGLTTFKNYNHYIKNHLQFLSSPGYTLAVDKYTKGLIFTEQNPYFQTYINRPGITAGFNILTSNKNGIIFDNAGITLTVNGFTLSSSLEIPSIVYTFSTPLNLTGSNYIEINAGLINDRAKQITEPININVSLWTDTNPSYLNCSVNNIGLLAPTVFYNSNIIDDGLRTVLSSDSPEKQELFGSPGVTSGAFIHGNVHLQQLKFPIKHFIEQESTFNFQSVTRFVLEFPTNSLVSPGITLGQIYIDSIYVK